LERPIFRAAAENPSASTTAMKARIRVSVSMARAFLADRGEGRATQSSFNVAGSFTVYRSTL
jgi:hypothetical protein